jgi:hypothetical protein
LVSQPKKEEVTGGCRQVQSEKLLYWILLLSDQGYNTHGRMRNAYMILVRKPEGKRLFEIRG